MQAEEETARLVAGRTARWRCRPWLAGRLEERNGTRLLADVELPLVTVLAAMEDAGVRVDPYLLGRDRGARRRRGRRARGSAPTSWRAARSRSARRSSSARCCSSGSALPADRKGKTGYSTDQRGPRAASATCTRSWPVVERWRELTKLHSTYLVALPAAIGADGRIHTTFSQTTAATGRLSSTNPEPAEHPGADAARPRDPERVRRRADGARLLAADYSQVELRILAHLSREPALVDAFQRGEDVHRATAAEVLGKPAAELTRDQRDRAKAVNFGIIYGISSFGLSEQLAIERDEAQPTSTPTSGGTRASREFIERTIARRRASAATPRRCSAAAGRCRSCARMNRQVRLAGRAAGRQLVHPGLGRRHHQGGDDRLPPAAARRGPRRRGSCCRSTTSCCSRCPTASCPASR